MNQTTLGKGCINGHYYEAGSSASVSAMAYENHNGSVDIYRADDRTLIRSIRLDDYQLSAVIPSVPVELCAHDGAVFQPHDRQFRWQSLRTGKQSWMARLESNRLSVMAVAVLLPLLLWWLITDVVPNTAEKAVDFLPRALVEQLDSQAFAALDKTFLEDTQLDPEKQSAIAALWQSTMKELSLPSDSYHLHFRLSDAFGANAFALPGGTVVVTDGLVELLSDNEDALLSVLLHEIAHVEHQHALRILARSTATTLFFSVFLGDVEGAGELIIGASTSLLNNAFSRDMERDADDYSMRQLQRLGKSPEAFANAMEALLSKHGDDGDDSPVMRYLSTHPSIKERIEKARALSQLNTP